MLRPGRGGLPTTAGAGYGNGGVHSPYYGSPSASGFGGGGYDQGSTGGGDNGSAYGGYTGGVAYGGYSGGSSEDFKDKPKRRNQNAILQKLKEPWAWSAALAVLFFLLSVRYNMQQRYFFKQVSANNFQQVIEMLRNIEDHKENLNNEFRTLQASTRKGKEDAALSFNAENHRLQTELMSLKAQQQKDEADRLAEKSRVLIREQAWKNQVQVLQQATSRESLRAAKERFGPGPHFVEFTVAFPNMPTESPERTFIVEMAPLNVMPHAVHLFLEQVTHGLWNNAWFYINGPHVLQAGPMADEAELEAAHAAGEDERDLALRPFRELQLDTLTFPEYSEDYPHVQWTLGYTGRPGGPDFYINKVDNTESHGPGGQFHHDLSEYADSCFAKIVKGFDTLSDMTEAPTVHEATEYQYFYEEPIHIVKVTIVRNPLKPEETELPILPEKMIADETATLTSKLFKEIQDRREESSGTNHRKPKMMYRPVIEHQVEY